VAQKTSFQPGGRADAGALNFKEFNGPARALEDYLFSRQQTIYRRSAYTEQQGSSTPADRAGPNTWDELTPSLVESFPAGSTWPAQTAALAARTIHACPHPFGQDSTFELRVRGRDVVECFAKWRCCVQPWLRVTTQPDAPGAQAFEGRRRVKNATECSVDSPNEHEVYTATGSLI
jgi:hypothetical protein